MSQTQYWPYGQKWFNRHTLNSEIVFAAALCASLCCLMSASILTGCSNVTSAKGNSTTSDSTAPTAGAVSAPSIALSASLAELNFGNVNTSSSSVLSLTLTNTGHSNIIFSNMTLSGAGFNASGVSTGQILTPGQTATLNVTFAPAAAGSVTGSILVASNASNSPATIGLSGTGVQVVSHFVDLGWTASTSVVAGYNVYRGSQSGGPYTKLNSTLVTPVSYTDKTVQSGQTYYYVVTSVDSNYVESAFSNQASAVIP